MSHPVKSEISGGKIMKKALCFLAIFSGLVIPKSHAQTTVTYPMQDANFPTQFNSGGDFFNNGSTELGMWANSGAKQTVGWENFTTMGAAGGTARNLQVGDVFITTVSATRAFGQIGFSLNAGGTQGSSYANNISGSRMYISTDNYAAWSVKGLSGGATSSLSYVPLQDTFKDYKFTVRITSQTTADVYLTADGTDYRAYNLALAGSAGANISAFSIFGSDMWDGNSSENAYWKQTTSVQNSGRVELGYYAANATTTTPGLITDGLAANSTSVTSANAVFIGGNAGSQVNLNQANTYTGQTTVNSAARLEVQNAGALGGTSNGTTVSDGGALSLYQATGGITVANEALTLAGTGVSGANGALRNTGGSNAWNGTVTLGANTRINADTSGSSGSLAIGGNISGGANVLFLGAQGGSLGNTGGDITVSGVISGAGATQDGTVTTLYKDGAGTLTLSGANNYTGGTTISEGTLQLGNGGTTGSLSASSSIINNGTLAFNRSSAVTQGTDFASVISGSGAVTTIGTGALTLGGNNTYSGTTTVATGGRLDVAQNANALGSTAAGTIVNSGGQLRLQNVTIGAEALTISGTGQVASVGAIRGGSGSSTYGGKVTLAANATVFTSGSVGLTFDVASGEAFDLGSNTLTFDGSGTHQVKDGISGTGGLLKTGSGTLAVSGTSSYNGTTTVSNGTLRADAAVGGRAFGNLSAVTLANAPANATALDLNNFSQTIGSLAGGVVNGTSSAGVTLGSGTLTTGGDNTSTSFAGVISGTGGGLTKTGSGTMTLAAANSYTGATAVNNGLLKILSGGSISSSSTTVNNGGTLDMGGTAGSVQVNSGGLLKGSGSVGAFTLSSGGTLAPGNSPGTLTAASATVLGGSTYNWEISALTGTAGTTWDLFSVGGLLNMSGVTSANKWNLVVTGDSGFAGWTDTNSYSYVFAQAASVSGFSSTVGTDVTSLFNITTSGIASKPNASFNVNGDFKVVVGSANGFTTLNLMAVPEPSSGSLLLAGIGSLIVLRRFRKKA
jgi:fibronectin-binding autotransporter adhesin